MMHLEWSSLSLLRSSHPTRAIMVS
uniref:Uncharacterized protein n=1 Tax=Rhizophora mucronata TaxID=61149 RepID=A0A2P2QX18_RHIMU